MDAKDILTSGEKFHINLGLGRIEKILKLLNNPESALKCVHIAGTNGKGSICAILEEIFLKKGLRTGKFTSPHLFSYTERITVDKAQIPSAELDFIVNEISNLDKANNIGLTEFETLTAAGFWWFQKQKCDVVILETGLGGRLDSTNIIKTPLAAVIASISLEHTEILGDTIEKIAAEKAGIIKENCPIAVLRENKGYDVISTVSKEKNAPLYEAKKLGIEEIKGENYAIIEGAPVKFPLRGAFQGENLALALKVIEILNAENTFGRFSKETVKEALSKVNWPFRLEEREIEGQKILIDACHNPDGARVLGEYLRAHHKNEKIKFIFGCLKNKDYKSVLAELPIQNEGNTFFFYEFNYPNALKFSGLPPEIQKIAHKTDNPLNEVANSQKADLTVICGSIYMLGEIFLHSR